MSRALISLLAVAVLGTAFAQTPTAPLEALEMDVLNPGEKPDQALERMSAKARQSQDDSVPGEAAVLEVRPTATYGTAPLSKTESRGLLPPSSDRAQERRREKDREGRREKDREVARDDDRDDDDGDHDDDKRKGKGKHGD